MEDSDPLTIPLASAFSSVNSGLGESLVASSSGVRTQFEQSLSDSFHIGTTINNADGSLTSKNFGLNSCMYMENGLNNQCNYMNNDDDEEDEGLYLAINSMPLKVELEEESSFCEVKQEVEEAHYNADQLNDSSLLRGEQGTASASWYNSNYMVDQAKLEQLDSASPKFRRRKPRSYFSDEERREREKLARRRLMAKERAKKYRNSLTPEQLQSLRERDRERTKKRRMMMSEDECLLVRIKNRENAQMRRMDAKGMEYKGRIEELDSDEEKALIVREKNRERMRLKRLNMTEEEKIIERQKNRDRVRKRRQIQKAESLLKKLINAHNDMVKQSTVEESKHFLQSLMDSNKKAGVPTINE